MYARMSRLPGLTVAPSRNPDFDVISGPGQLWNFTKTTHPAYPSVACRRIVRDQDGDLRVETQLSCNAAKPECDQLAAGYAALDKEMMDALKQKD
jgi:hypothetical protein